VIEVNGETLLSILNANRENFIRQNMVEKGNTLEEAEREIGLLLALAERLGEAELSLRKREGRLEALLELEFNRF